MLINGLNYWWWWVAVCCAYLGRWVGKWRSVNVIFPGSCDDYCYIGWKRLSIAALILTYVVFLLIRLMISMAAWCRWLASLSSQFLSCLYSIGSNWQTPAIVFAASVVPGLEAYIAYSFFSGWLVQSRLKKMDSSALQAPHGIVLRKLQCSRLCLYVWDLSRSGTGRVSIPCYGIDSPGHWRHTCTQGTFCGSS